MLEGAVAMSLRERPPPEPKAGPMFNFRCPPAIREYLREAASAPGRNQTEVVVSALELDRDLAQLLAPDVARIHAYAEEQGLQVGPDLPRVLAQLVRAGLDAHAQKKRGGGRK